MPVSVRRGSRCLRGLHWLLESDPPLPERDLIQTVERAFTGPFVRMKEVLGGHVVHRLIIQYRAEFRIGEAPGQVSVLHRINLPESRREQDRARLAGALESCMKEHCACAHP